MIIVDIVKDVCIIEDLFFVMVLVRWLWSCGIDIVEFVIVVIMVVFIVFVCGIVWIVFFEVMLLVVIEFI